MSAKIVIYLFVTVFVVLSLDSLNINGIFKKNKVYQAKLFMFIIGLSLIYLITNFIYDIITFSKII